MIAGVGEALPIEVAARLRSGDERILLLDVREAEELRLARVERAVHIPMGDIPSRLQSIDEEREIVVMCHHGARSFKVALFLVQQGFPNVKNLRGGIDAWSCEADAGVPRY